MQSGFREFLSGFTRIFPRRTDHNKYSTRANPRKSAQKSAKSALSYFFEPESSSGTPFFTLNAVDLIFRILEKGSSVSTRKLAS